VGAQEDERRRIARELHDDFTQRLAVLAIDIAAPGKEGNPGIGFNYGVGESNVDFGFTYFEVDSSND
jgi:hypothetical protein